MSERPEESLWLRSLVAIQIGVLAWLLLILSTHALAYAFGALSIKGDDGSEESWFVRYEDAIGVGLAVVSYCLAYRFGWRVLLVLLAVLAASLMAFASGPYPR